MNFWNVVRENDRGTVNTVRERSILFVDPSRLEVHHDALMPAFEVLGIETEPFRRRTTVGLIPAIG